MKHLVKDIVKKMGKQLRSKKVYNPGADRGKTKSTRKA